MFNFTTWDTAELIAWFHDTVYRLDHLLHDRDQGDDRDHKTEIVDSEIQRMRIEFSRRKVNPYDV